MAKNSFAKDIYAKCIAKGMSQKKAYQVTGAILRKRTAAKKATVQA